MGFPGLLVIIIMILKILYNRFICNLKRNTSDNNADIKNSPLYKKMLDIKWDNIEKCILQTTWCCPKSF